MERGNGLRRLAAVVTLALTCLAFAAPSSDAVVTGVFPELGCVDFDQVHNTVTGIFGYTSGNDGNVIIPIGPNNLFSPPPINRGQPTVFFPGINHQAFSLTFFGPPNPAVTWNLLGNSVTAGLGSAECEISPGAAPAVWRGPTVSGIPFVGQPLSADPGVYKGDVGDVAYQWQRSDGSGGWASIDGATSSAYTPTGDDAGKALRVEITAKSAAAAAGDDGGVTTVDSPPTDPVGAPPTGAWPTISGKPFRGRTLTADPGMWTGVSSFTYDWQRCHRTCVSTGVTTPTYTITRADLLRGLRVVVRPSGMSEPAGASAEMLVL